jgi:catechol 2,3-dioxygenase-like lactoylglutathione lyase family enzyme
MAIPQKLAHVVYMTRRFDEMISWYQQVFEAKVQYQNSALAFLTYDDEHHRFAFVNMSVFNPNGGDADVPASAGVNHVGYTYADLGELLETYDRLKQVGITPYWRIHHGITVSVYYQDPTVTVWSFRLTAAPMQPRLMPSCTVTRSLRIPLVSRSILTRCWRNTGMECHLLR